MHAAECGELEICKVLIEEVSCDITKTEQFGREALHFAVEFEHLDCVKYLLSKGARVTHADSTENGTTPLAYACTSTSLPQSLQHQHQQHHKQHQVQKEITVLQMR